MKIRTKLWVAFLVIVFAGFFWLVDRIIEDLRIGYIQAMEESLLDASMVLASLVESQMEGETVQTEALRAAFEDAGKKRFRAQIYELEKTGISMRAYVTDKDGIVLFDSDGGRDEGKDYSRWNDVHRTLRGEYGARASRSDPDDPMTANICVASPIKHGDAVVGVLTLSKPTQSVAPFILGQRKAIAFSGVAIAVAVAALGAIISSWITRPVEQLTEYANAVRDGKRIAVPKVGGGEIGALARAFDEMQSALEGKKYVEEYVQTLTHQMKSPLSAIRGTAELLDEEMEPGQRKRFHANLKSESARLQDLLDRLLQLSELENRRELRDVETIELSSLASEVVTDMQPLLVRKRLQARLEGSGPVPIRGERFLLYQAISNILQNAVDFSKEASEVVLKIEEHDGEATLSVLDSGPGIPDYALERVFERFYSLQRPDTGKRSSGLGLTFVKEVMELHGGSVSLDNRPEGGVVAMLTIPKPPKESAA